MAKKKATIFENIIKDIPSPKKQPEGPKYNKLKQGNHQLKAKPK